MDANLKQLIDRIMTYLLEGERWHLRVAAELRKLPGKRGYARLHDNQAICYAKLSKCFSKTLRDYLNYSPVIDTGYAGKAETYTINAEADFQSHFDVWTRRETQFIETVNEAIPLAEETDIKLYKKLCKLSKGIKTQLMRADWIKKNLAYANWEPHHVVVVSKWLHEQAEKNPHEWNFNIG